MEGDGFSEIIKVITKNSQVLMDDPRASELIVAFIETLARQEPQKNERHVAPKVIEVGDACRESYPCRHSVKINGIPHGTWTGREILQWYLDNNQEVPEHFHCYK